jgi:hypothetical protein
MGLYLSTPPIDVSAVAFDPDADVTLGLLGTSNSLAYRVAEAERHFHSYESWFGAAVAASAPTHMADRIGTSVTAFVIDGGGGAGGSWGTWIQILGSTDTPARSGNVKYDFHKMFVTAVERASTVHLVQIGFGTSGAAALLAGTYTEFVYRSGAAVQREAPVEFQTRRMATGTIAWARCWAIGADTGTLGFFVGLHEYEG